MTARPSPRTRGDHAISGVHGGFQQGKRLAGIDAARGIALLGMMATHILPLFQDAPGWPPTLVGLVFSGRSAALFAVLAGIGLALYTGKETPHEGAVLRADRRALAARAVVIAAVGLSLGAVDVNVAVILVHYAVLFLCMLPFLRLRVAALIPWAAGWLLLSPILAYLVRPWLLAPLPALELEHNPVWTDLASPARLLGDVFFTGYYPVVQWMSYLLVGLALGRLALSSLRVQLSLLAGGATLAVLAKWLGQVFLFDLGGMNALLLTEEGRRWPLRSVLQVNLAGVEQEDSWWWLLGSAPHSGTTLDLVHTGALAAAVVGLCLLIARIRPQLLLPLSGAGAMTLTLYTAHVAFLGLTSQGLPVGVSEESLYFVHAAVALLVGSGFALLRWRGPLELAAHAAATVARGRA